MNRREREDLLAICRQRERLAKAAAATRSAQLLADFETQLDTEYHYVQDAVWKAAAEAAHAAVAEAQKAVKARCRELGIPCEFAPSIHCSWYSKGQSASKERLQCAYRSSSLLTDSRRVRPESSWARCRLQSSSCRRWC